ncbi:MAG: hypothetical protein WBF58_17440 [Xanthobacteraceae bacterium]
MPARSELTASVAILPRQPSATDKFLSAVGATLRNPEFQIVALFCAIGLGLTLVAIQHFPGFAETVASLDQF